MAYIPHYLVEFGGNWTETEEVWACTIRGNPYIGESGFDPDTWLGDVQGPLASWFAAGSSFINSHANLTYLKCNPIGADGKYSDPTTHAHFYGLPYPHGANDPACPGFIDLVYSFGTGLKRGRAHAGRMYPPNTDTITSAFEINLTKANAHATAAHALLVLLRNASGTTGQELALAVFSRIDGSAHSITEVSVDTVFDYQGRRKNRVKGDRATIAFP